MQTAARPRINAGIAALGASALIATTAAVAPHHIALPTLPAVPGVTSSVELKALVNPFAAIGEVVQSTVSDVQQLVSGILQNPFPIAGVVVPQAVANLGQILKIGQTAVSSVLSGLASDIPSSIQSFIQYAKAGDFQDAFTYFFTPLVGVGINLYTPLVDLFKIIAGPVATVANVIEQVPSLLLQAAVGVAIGPLSTVVTAVGAGIDSLGAALKSGNLGNVYNAVVNSAVNFTKTVIAQLVGPYGVVANLLNLRTALAQVLHPVSAAAATAATQTPAASAVSASATKSLTLSATATAAAATSSKATATKSGVKPAATTDSAASDATADTETATPKTKRDHGKKDAATTAPTATSTSSSSDSSSSSASDSSAADNSSSNTKGDKGRHGKGDHKAGASGGSKSHASHNSSHGK